MDELKQQIKFEDFSKLDIRIGEVLVAEEVEESEKLIRMDVDFGDVGKRQIIAGIKLWYSPLDLIGKKMAFIINIEPRKVMGLESQGMVLAADSKEKVSILLPTEDVPNGTLIR